MLTTLRCKSSDVQLSQVSLDTIHPDNKIDLLNAPRNARKMTWKSAKLEVSLAKKSLVPII